MSDKKQISNRQYAASIARKFFSGQISKHETLDSFPDYESDFKMKLLYNRIMTKPRKSWLFGVSNKTYKRFLIETYEIIQDLEVNKLRSKTMKRLFKELWFRSNNCSASIENISIAIKEVAHSTSNSKEEIRKYLLLLIDSNYLKKISDQPLIFEFTETGKIIKTDLDIENLIKT